MASNRTSDKKVAVTPMSAAPAPARRKPSSKRTVHTTAEVSHTPVIEAPDVVSAAAASIAAPAESFRDAVAQLAYSYYAARGYQGGSPEEDWLRAEQELLAR